MCCGVQNLLLGLAIQVIQEAIRMRSFVVVSENVDGGVLLGILVITCIGKPGQQRIVTELGG